jgi:hypothetical protein
MDGARATWRERRAQCAHGLSLTTHHTPTPHSRWLPAGLDATFEARASQGGFVEKQAFLSRVDERQAVGDAARRAEERRARDLAAMAGAGRNM